MRISKFALLFGTVIMLGVHLKGTALAVAFEQKLPEYDLPPIVQVTLGEGKKFLFVLDAGAGIHMFDTTLRPFLGAQGKTIPFNSGTSKYHVAELDRSPELAIEALRIAPSNCAVVDLNSFRMASGVDIRGFLSLERAFPKSQVRLNFDQQLLAITDSSSVVSNDMLALEMSYSEVSGVPFVEGEFCGRRREFVIDTGASPGVGLDGALYSELVSKGVIKNDASMGDVAVAGEVIRVRRGVFASGEWFGVALKEVNVIEVHGRCFIGMQLLLHLNTILDFGNRKFYYQVRRSFPPRVVYPETIIFRKGENPVFKITDKESPESRAGIRDGDELIRLGSVNGAKLDRLHLLEVCQHLRGKDLEIEVLHPGDQTPMVTKMTLTDAH